ncbi:MAG: hypothetical protein SNJ71_06825 [Bacteroidales bacterium]
MSKLILSIAFCFSFCINGFSQQELYGDLKQLEISRFIEHTTLFPRGDSIQVIYSYRNKDTTYIKRNEYNELQKEAYSLLKRKRTYYMPLYYNLIRKLTRVVIASSWEITVRFKDLGGNEQELKYTFFREHPKRIKNIITFSNKVAAKYEPEINKMMRW